MNRYVILLTVTTEQVAEQVRFLETLRTCFGMAAAFLLLISTVLFFYFDIRTVIGEKRSGSRRPRKRQKGKKKAEEICHRIPKESAEALTAVLPQRRGAAAGKFVIRKNIMLIHTDEYI